MSEKKAKTKKAIGRKAVQAKTSAKTKRPLAAGLKSRSASKVKKPIAKKIGVRIIVKSAPRYRKFELVVNLKRQEATVASRSLTRSFLRIVSLVLLLTMNWASLVAITPSAAYFYDTETSSGNNLVAGAVDFSLESDHDFTPVCAENGQPSRRTISISNLANPIKYRTASVGLQGGLCDHVLFEAGLEGSAAIYSGRLADFNVGPYDLSDTEQWEYSLRLPAEIPDGLSGADCQFKLDFLGSQIRHGLDIGTGFSDREEITGRIVAPVCQSGETRSMGYWKNHSEIYQYYLPVILGSEAVDSVQQANDIFNANNSSMRNKLKKQLLAMKFNIAVFGIGEYFVVAEGKTLSEVVAEADALLAQSPPPSNSVLEAIKNLLDHWNNDRAVRICACAPPDTGKIVINKVYYDVDEAHGAEPENEWIELYNPNDHPVNIAAWTIMDNAADDVLATTSPLVVPALGYAVITASTTTWDYWDLPPDTARYVLADGAIGDGLDNAADILILKDKEGREIDRMNWGEPDEDWFNYNNVLWDPGIAGGATGQMLGRVPSGTDTDSPADWSILSPPEVELLAPVGGEVWYAGHLETIRWTAANPNGDQDPGQLKINLYYSADSGRTWGTIATSSPNDGIYYWRVPIFIEPGHYYVPSPTARIRVVAVGPENFMAQARDESDDFCPPIDYDSLDADTQAMVDRLIREGVIDESEVIRGGLGSQTVAPATTTPELDAPENNEPPPGGAADLPPGENVGDTASTSGEAAVETETPAVGDGDNVEVIVVENMDLADILVTDLDEIVSDPAEPVIETAPIDLPEPPSAPPDEPVPDPVTPATIPDIPVIIPDTPSPEA